MAGARSYRNPIYAADFRDLRGFASVVPDRDRTDGTPRFRVSYVSGGGDVAFTSRPMELEDHAFAAARVIAELVGGQLLERPPPESKRAALAGDPNCVTQKQTQPNEIAEFIQAKLIS